MAVMIKVPQQANPNVLAGLTYSMNEAQITIYKLTLAKPRTNYSKRSFSYSPAQVRLSELEGSEGFLFIPIPFHFSRLRSCVN